MHKTEALLPTPSVLREIYAPIEEDLRDVERLLVEELRSRFPFVDGLIQHGFRLAGKRLRPALVLLSGKACGGVAAEHLMLAGVMELIHTATLIHDDVLDEAAIRRHLETVNARWDNEVSVLLGDYLLAQAMCLAARLEGSAAIRAVSQACRAVCEGEIRQIGNRGNFALSEAEYLDIIANKTAALCACCCRVGALLSGAAPPVQEALGRYGRHLGIAFQIIDDVLDVRGSEADTGKSLGTDLVKAKATLPVIRLLGQLDARRRSELLQSLETPAGRRLDALRPYFEDSDALDYSELQARAHSQRAKDVLDAVAPSAARDKLAELADFVVHRRQ